MAAGAAKLNVHWDSDESGSAGLASDEDGDAWLAGRGGPRTAAGAAAAAATLVTDEARALLQAASPVLKAARASSPLPPAPPSAKPAGFAARGKEIDRVLTDLRRKRRHVRKLERQVLRGGAIGSADAGESASDDSSWSSEKTTDTASDGNNEPRLSHSQTQAHAAALPKQRRRACVSRLVPVREAEAYTSAVIQEKLARLRADKAERVAFKQHLEHAHAIQQRAQQLALYNHPTAVSSPRRWNDGLPADATTIQKEDLVERNRTLVSNWKDYQRDMLQYRQQMIGYTKARRELLDKRREEQLELKTVDDAEARAARRGTQFWLTAFVHKASAAALAQAVRAGRLARLQRQRAPRRPYRKANGKRDVPTTLATPSSPIHLDKEQAADILASFLRNFDRTFRLRFCARRFYDKVRCVQSFVRGWLQARRGRLSLWYRQWDGFLHEMQSKVEERNERRLARLKSVYKKSSSCKTKLDTKAVTVNRAVFNRLERMPTVPDDMRDQILHEVFTKRRWEQVMARRRWELNRRRVFRNTEENADFSLTWKSREILDERPPHFPLLIPQAELSALVTAAVASVWRDRQKEIRAKLAADSPSVSMSPAAAARARRPAPALSAAAPLSPMAPGNPRTGRPFGRQVHVEPERKPR
ncbi:hypothetical protein DIPPA_10901 [Diplonema papillatum]|nr:hypothetical protein DIPPA_10901 [Diplonema papillatum]